MLLISLSCIFLNFYFESLRPNSEAKLVYWDSFQLGAAPMLIGIFFFGAIQTFFIGVLGEYVGSIHTQVRNMPLVVEIERVNF